MKFLSVPFSGGSLGKNNGCESAPQEIFRLLKLKYDNLDINNFNIDNSGKFIYNYVSSARDKLFLVGGDHSITYYSFKAYAEKNKNCGLLVFDAHPDVQSSDFVTHEDYLRMLIDSNIVKSSNIVLVGLRSISKEELAYLKDHKIVYFDMNKIYDLGVKEVCDLIMEKMNQLNGFYLSIDIDVVDPAFAPGTGYLEPGGLSSSDIIYIFNRLKKMKSLDIIDLVEINPTKDINNITLILGSKIIGVFL